MSEDQLSVKDAPAPAPWTLKAQFWAIFVLSSHPTKTAFPSGWATSGEADALAEGGEFIGGMGFVMAIAYQDSPVGTDNELIYIPGQWKYPDGSKGFRVTRIYVSSQASVINGRRNWGVPKHLAEFDYVRSASNGDLKLNVRLPGSTELFFDATISRIPVVSLLKLPVNSKVFGGWLTLVQPPLPQGEKPEEVDSQKWSKVTPPFKCNAFIGKGLGKMDGGRMADGINFPAVAPWSLVTVLENVDLTFGEADRSMEV
ncbi:hypothetical protein BDZ89DRAFT_1062323 [Hymenopellis radicata]|nr:hypothetical protein BDZ89DRAFT_1062323 [Hymenopellis radicata]